MKIPGGSSKYSNENLNFEGREEKWFHVNDTCLVDHEGWDKSAESVKHASIDVECESEEIQQSADK